MVSLIAKMVFMSKFLGSCRNEWQRVGRYKEGQKILHEILIKSAIEQDLSGHRTGHLIYIFEILQPNVGGLSCKVQLQMINR